MKRMIALLLAILLLSGCGAAQVAEEEVVTETETVQEAETAEETQAEDTDMSFGEFTADSLDGGAATEGIFAAADLTVVNLWATYCDPCKEEMPILAKLDEELENVQVVGIVLDCTDQNGDPDPAQVELAVDLMEAAGATYTNLILNLDLAKLGIANAEVVPATLFVDKNGDRVGQGFYGALDEETWRAEIAARLEMIKQ